MKLSFLIYLAESELVNFFRLVDLDEKEKDEGPSWNRGADVMTTGRN